MPLSDEERARYAALGFVETTAAEWLGLDEIDRLIVEMRLAMGRAVREARKARGVTQSEFGEEIGSTQSATARVEGGSASTSLEAAVRAYLATGGTIELKPAPVVPKRAGRGKEKKGVAR